MKFFSCIFVFAFAIIVLSCGKETSGLNEIPSSQNSLEKFYLSLIGNEDVAKKLVTTVKARTVPNDFLGNRSSDFADSGKYARQFWSGDEWLTYQGSLTRRWRQQVEVVFPGIDPGRSFDDEYWKDNQRIPAVKPFSSLDLRFLRHRYLLDELSPSEKWDLLSGHTDFRFTKSLQHWKESLRAAEEDKKIPFFSGLCNGWAMASTLEETPARWHIDHVTISGKTYPITIYADDIKAWLSYAYAQRNVKRAYLGDVCKSNEAKDLDEKNRIKSIACRDVNPGDFHMVLADMVTRGEPLLADFSQFDAVFNRPIVGYKFMYLNHRSLGETYMRRSGTISGNTTHLIDVKAEVQRMDSYVATEGRSGHIPKSATETYRYTLELDPEGHILGGEWHPTSTQPDFLWSVRQKFDAPGVEWYNNAPFKHFDVNRLRRLLQSTGQPTDPAPLVTTHGESQKVTVVFEEVCDPGCTKYPYSYAVFYRTTDTPSGEMQSLKIHNAPVEPTERKLDNGRIHQQYLMEVYLPNKTTYVQIALHALDPRNRRNVVDKGWVNIPWGWLKYDDGFYGTSKSFISQNGKFKGEGWILWETN